METRSVAFTVHGVAAPAGSKTLGYSTGGKAFVREASKRSAPWRRLVSREAGLAMEGQPLLDGPLGLRVRVYVVRPKSHYGARGLRPSAPTAPITRPDLTKYLRGIEDALKGIVWRDDSQVVWQEAQKVYGEPARAEIEVRTV